ncbi:hypothetical protein AMTR_s00034p00240540 [Amborella trichopoda]|uniref:Uncharacterized protein n=1 Tax=Amborella trichopoda TaxID=13333 RepID=W1PW08_AMBTC|nr:hypothetical protein AMTR_s00034p00240540 [Amborella trichopoda]
MASVTNSVDGSHSEGLCEGLDPVGPHEGMVVMDHSSMLCPEEPPSGTGCVKIPSVTVRLAIFGKAPPLSPFPVVGKKVAFYKYSHSLVLWLLAVVVAGQYQASVVAFNLLLFGVAKMYPLFHRSAARKAHSSPRPMFNLLVVDPLAMVIVDENEGVCDFEEGEIVPEIGLACVELDSQSVEENGPFVDDHGHALVEVAISTPLKVIR